MERAEKEALVKDFNEIFSSAITGVLVDFKGSTVEELTILRKTLYEKGSKMRVIKNTLAKLAASGTPFEPLKAHFEQTRALIYSTEDPATPAKIVSGVVEKNQNLKLIAGLLVTAGNGTLLDAEGVKALGNLPSKEELLAKLLFLLSAPATQFARVLNEVPASFVRVLQSIADSKS
jgi:large subunit ribosomal protein L10